MKKPWHPKEIELLKSGVSIRSIAKALGRGEASVRGKLAHLGISSPGPVAATYAEDKTRQGNDYWRGQFQTIAKKYGRLLKEAGAVEQLVNLATTLAPKSYDTAPPIAQPSGNGQPQTMVALLSDCHVGAVVRPEQTGGFGRYDFPTFLARLKFYETAIVSILQDHTTTKVPELVLCLGGDMLDGMLDHCAESGQPNTLFTQFYGAGHAIAQFIRAVSARVPKVRVYCTAGNHTRWSSQKKMPTDNRFSNFDTVLYAFLEALTKDIPHVKWNLDEQPFSRFSIYGFRFQLLHGDTLRGADRAFGLPAHSIGRLVSATTSLCEREGEVAPHFFLCGHLHRQFALPLAKGSFIINGGFPGLDGYGMSQNFTPVSPTQVLFMVHPKFGKTATFDIQLGLAKVGTKPPYSIPGSFPVE